MEMYGERLRLRRKARGLSQNQLGRLVGCTGHTIGDYEQYSNQPRSRIKDRIAEVLGEF